jgi:hypothetical protein
MESIYHQSALNTLRDERCFRFEFNWVCLRLVVVLTELQVRNTADSSAFCLLFALRVHLPMRSQE